MRPVALDAERLAQLRVFDQSEVREIAAGSVAAIAKQLKLIDAALGASDHSSAAEAAHNARNEVLVIGALRLGEAFARLEQAARRGDGAGAGAAAREAGAAWPATRQAIMQFADHAGPARG